VQAFFDEATNSVSYLVGDPVTGTAAIIDPVLGYDPASGRIDVEGAERVLATARDTGLSIEWILETHAHADHLSAADHLKRRIGAKTAIGAGIRNVQKAFAPQFGGEGQSEGGDFDRLLEDGDVLPLGRVEIEVIATPGHTPACVSYRIGDAVFVGDTMFMPDYGTARADFPGGDARTLYQSAKRLLSLPPETRLFMCHDYLPEGRTDYVWETTVEAERSSNVHIHDGVSEDEFVAMREARDKTLAMPRLILPSVQVNMRAGHLPPPEDNGITYLKIPVNAL